MPVCSSENLWAVQLQKVCGPFLAMRQREENRGKIQEATWSISRDLDLVGVGVIFSKTQSDGYRQHLGKSRGALPGNSPGSCWITWSSVCMGTGSATHLAQRTRPISRRKIQLGRRLELMQEGITMLIVPDGPPMWLGKLQGTCLLLQMSHVPLSLLR